MLEVAMVISGGAWFAWSVAVNTGLTFELEPLSNK
jgi:hypothetical protein